MDENNLIGQRIKSLREQLDLSQEGLGDLVGVSCQSVQQWESGKTVPRHNRLRKIANELKTTPNYLQFGVGPEAADSAIDVRYALQTEEFKNQHLAAITKAFKLAVSMGWIGVKRPDVSLNIIGDLFYTKLLEEYGMEPGELENPNSEDNQRKGA